MTSKTDRTCWEGRGVAITAKLIRAHPKPIPHPILECPFAMYQILCVPQAEKQSFPSTNLDRLGKTGGYLQLRSFTFLPAQSLFSSSCRWQLETSCPKLIILARSLLRTILDPASWWLRFLHSRLSCEDPCWNDPNWGDNLLGGSSQNDPNCEHSLEEKELLLQLQQWQPCEWQD